MIRELLSQASMASNKSEEPPDDAVECDPTRRYWRFEEVLGKGAFKTVYKAFDEREGIEVAWNKVDLGVAVSDGDNRDRLFAEIKVLKRLKHKNIMTFYDSWLDEKSRTLNFITELFTDGSLRKFRSRHKHLELKVLKKWAWQILQGLVYLHGHDPPIIHRDLKCDNIFINGVLGVLKIGDLGLATLWKGLTAAHSILGTPEFMAPEYYDEKYDEKVDVYAFGMLLLELVTMEYPYCECTNPGAIFKKVSQGVYPASIQKVRTPELREFIERCIAHDPKHRPAARKLLKDPFFDSIRMAMDPKHQSAEDLGAVSNGHSTQSLSSEAESDHMSTHHEDLGSHDMAGLPHTKTDPESEASGGTSTASMQRGSHGLPPNSPFAVNERQNFRVECTKADGSNLMFKLKFEDREGKNKIIQFPFNLDDDTADQIVAEMLEDHSYINLSITEEEAKTIGQMIAEEVEQSRNMGSEELTAYINVSRSNRDETAEMVAGSPRVDRACPSAKCEDEDMMRTLTAKADDILHEVASDASEAHVMRTLSTKAEDILGAMRGQGDGFGSGRWPPMPSIPEQEEQGGVQDVQMEDADVWVANGHSREMDASEVAMDESGGNEVESVEPTEGVWQRDAVQGEPSSSPWKEDIERVGSSSVPGSPPVLSHMRIMSDISANSRRQRAKSEPAEPPEPPDDSSSVFDRGLCRMVSSRHLSDGGVGLKAHYRREVNRYGDVRDDMAFLGQGSGGRFSPRVGKGKDPPAWPSSLAVVVLDNKGGMVDNPAPGQKESPSRSIGGESPDARKSTLISVLTMKPHAPHAIAPGPPFDMGAFGSVSRAEFPEEEGPPGDEEADGVVKSEDNKEEEMFAMTIEPTPEEVTPQSQVQEQVAAQPETGASKMGLFSEGLSRSAPLKVPSPPPAVNFGPMSQTASTGGASVSEPIMTSNKTTPAGWVDMHMSDKSPTAKGWTTAETNNAVKDSQVSPRVVVRERRSASDPLQFEDVHAQILAPPPAQLMFADHAWQSTGPLPMWNSHNTSAVSPMGGHPLGDRSVVAPPFTGMGQPFFSDQPVGPPMLSGAHGLQRSVTPPIVSPPKELPPRPPRTTSDPRLLFEEKKGDVFGGAVEGMRSVAAAFSDSAISWTGMESSPQGGGLHHATSLTSLSRVAEYGRTDSACDYSSAWDWDGVKQDNGSRLETQRGVSMPHPNSLISVTKSASVSGEIGRRGSGSEVGGFPGDFLGGPPMRDFSIHQNGFDPHSSSAVNVGAARSVTTGSPSPPRNATYWDGLGNGSSHVSWTGTGVHTMDPFVSPPGSHQGDRDYVMQGMKQVPKTGPVATLNGGGLALSAAEMGKATGFGALSPSTASGGISPHVGSSQCDIDLKAQQKSISKEECRRAAAEKMKRMEEEQLEVLVSGRIGGASRGKSARGSSLRRGAGIGH